MRLSPVLTVLAVLLVASVALAKTTGSANITSLGSSGISGTADFAITGNGVVKVHESLSGLTPGVQYQSFGYSNSTSCGSGGTRALIQTFTANAAGKANLNLLAPLQVSPVDAFSSVSVQLAGDPAILACGEIQ